MASFPNNSPVLFLLIITLTSTFLTTATPTIGVTINHRPSTTTPEHIASIIHHHKISAVRLLNPDPPLIRAFSYSSVSLLLSIPNSLIPSLSSNRSNTATWLFTHVVPFYPRANITLISVGDDPLSSSSDNADHLLPAIRNLHLTLHQLGIRNISVSTTFSLPPLLTTAFPPSSSEFTEPLNDVVIRPLLDFLEEVNSYFLVNIHPYKLYQLNHDIVLGFALFQETPFGFTDDTITGVRYHNLFDIMVDAVLAALAVAGHENIPVIVTETGWPNTPGSDTGEENYANQVYAEMYLKGLIKHLKSGYGTPLKKDGVSEVYLYELIDRDMSEVNSSQPVRQWGLFNPNLTCKYDIDLSGSTRTSPSYGCFFTIFLVIYFLGLH